MVTMWRSREWAYMCLCASTGTVPPPLLAFIPVFTFLFAMSSHTLVVNRTPVPHTTPRHPYHGFRNTQSTHYPRAFCHYTPVPSDYAASTQMVVTLDGAPSLRPSVKSRKRVTPHQLKHLERVFAGETHPSRGSREELARDLGMCVSLSNFFFPHLRFL